MCITAIPMFSLEAEAAGIKVGLNTSSNDVSGSEVTSHADIATKLDKIFAGNVGLYYDSAKKNPVSAKLGTRTVPLSTTLYWKYISTDKKLMVLVDHRVLHMPYLHMVLFTMVNMHSYH